MSEKLCMVSLQQRQRGREREGEGKERKSEVEGLKRGRKLVLETITKK